MTVTAGDHHVYEGVTFWSQSVKHWSKDVLKGNCSNESIAKPSIKNNPLKRVLN